MKDRVAGRVLDTAIMQKCTTTRQMLGLSREMQNTESRTSL